MAFIINPDGSIKVDTPDELRQVLALREQATKPVGPAPSAKDEPKVEPPSRMLFEQPRPTADGSDQSYRRFYGSLDGHPKYQRLLRALLDSPDVLSDEEARSALRLASLKDLRGLLIGMYRLATNRGLKASPIVKTVSRTDGGKTRTYYYGVTVQFRRAMEGYQSEKMAV